MRIVLFAAAAITLLGFAPATTQAAGEVVLDHQEWSFDGPFGRFDRQQLQRGFQVYREICSSCHGLDYIAFRNLKAIGYSEDQTKVLASEYTLEECCDDQGDIFDRPAIPADYMPNPYPNEQFARASNNGALPPDLSLMTKARHGGPDYMYSLIIGYQDPPAEMEAEMMDGMYYNTVFEGNQIAMAQQLFDELIEYSDGTPATTEQMAKDVSAFLHWAAEPKLEVRKQTGIRVLLFTFIFTVLAYFLKRRIWADVKH
ncbi:MAG: cytochrome c1 [Rhodospirillaceae bacterium]|jgi:ubiquinol-cytochrome c reductase cytochrome c1 subunit|nr:cytochrome c1 [Rhodospirillaceae bacterium]MBT5241153.1 cytochrome c1 [Rhodospirillaceae bacterium]MBT5565665.1 cytochrome c1 [Rhodospirillaceae bacterium]MBT6090871.1 cytochrome c1 [Rhodospirillaceae bacterium]MBT7451398.1 cytochrome c1 [Rhodospirillaceae bacterium]